ncbi:hypothetical protein SLS58_008451 [Diplodia intermedia]|uniref:Uncharacterized protein n=1 Tax=Diplodia intermedia TaxID=856260 RepID=A0ABR3THA9_9PEZI
MDHRESAAHDLLAMSQEERLHSAARPRMPSQETDSSHSAVKSDRDKYTSPNPPASSITPPPSSQVPPAPPSRTSIRTPTPPTPVLSSPPPTSRPSTQAAAPALSFTLEQINGAAPEELRDMAADMMVALRESRTSAAHHKLQYNMLCMDSVEAQNRMAVELAMAQREVEVLQQAEERRRNDIASPHQSLQQQHTVSPANATLLNEMSRHIQILQNENEELRDMLEHSKRVTERREGEIAGLVEENDRLRGRIRKNRDHLNGILGDVYDTASSTENVINESDKDTEIDESQASQMASSMLRRTPQHYTMGGSPHASQNQSQSQSHGNRGNSIQAKLFGQVKKPGVGRPAEKEKRSISGVDDSEAGNSAKRSRVNESSIGLGIGGVGSSPKRP